MKTITAEWGYREDDSTWISITDAAAKTHAQFDGPYPAMCRRLCDAIMAEPIVKAARKFCDAQKEIYAELLNSDSMAIDAEFMSLCHAVYGEPKQEGGKWVPGS